MSTRSAWLAALAYALLGRVPDELPQTRTAGDLLAALERLAPAEVDKIRTAARTSGRLTAHPVPADVRGAVGYAQLHALLQEVELVLLDRSAAGPVVSDRPLDAAERRLVADAPPHH